jgi:hypothetical protein
MCKRSSGPKVAERALALVRHRNRLSCAASAIAPHLRHVDRAHVGRAGMSSSWPPSLGARPSSGPKSSSGSQVTSSAAPVSTSSGRPGRHFFPKSGERRLSFER